MNKKAFVDCIDISGSTVSEFEGTRQYLSTGALKRNFIDYGEVEEVTFKSRPSRANINVKVGDILFAKMQNTVKVLEISNETKDLIVSTGFFVVHPRDGVDKEFIFQYLNSEHFNNQKDNNCTGATQKALTNVGLKKITVPNLNLMQQQKIGAALAKVRFLTDKRHEQIVMLDKLAKDMFVEMFGDPVKNEGRWEIRYLPEFYKGGKQAVKCGPFGSTLKKNEYSDTGIAVWTMDNISKLGEFIDEPYLRIPATKYEELESYRVENGDVLISRAGTVGKMCVVNSIEKESIISTNLIRVRFNETLLLPEYFVWLILCFGARVVRLKTGGDDSFTHMNTGVLDSISFPYPPMELQLKFRERLNAIAIQKTRLQDSLAELETTYKSTLQRAFNGELFQ